MSSSRKTANSRPHIESDADRLRRMTTPDALSVDLVSAYAGDRDMTEDEAASVGIQRVIRGDLFFSDLLYAVTHQYYPPEIAAKLWESIIAHKSYMSAQLRRNVRITVAALDYLSNVTSQLAAPTLISENYVTKIANLSMRDGMTGLFNHSTCYELLALELRNHRRYGVGLSLIMVDIDDFKDVNDRYGHQEGDRMLIELARAMTTKVRDSDVCCRFGGEEFVVILPFTRSPLEAREVAERVRVRAAAIECGPVRITISAGVAVCDHAESTPRTLIEQADQALYLAKRGGKNKVVLAAGRAPPESALQ